MKQHQELLAIETDIEFKQIGLTVLEQNDIQLTPAELKAIIWLLEVEPEEDSQVPDDMPASIGEGP